jgi:hypothetical protein
VQPQTEGEFTPNVIFVDDPEFEGPPPPHLLDPFDDEDTPCERMGPHVTHPIMSTFGYSRPAGIRHA